MDCARANEFMIEFVEGTLPADQHEKVKEHVEGCRACMKDLEEVSSTSRVLQALGKNQLAAPEDLGEEISQSIRKTPSWYFLKRYGVPAGVVVAIVALVLLALALGVLVFGR